MMLKIRALLIITICLSIQNRAECQTLEGQKPKSIYAVVKDWDTAQKLDDIEIFNKMADALDHVSGDALWDLATLDPFEPERISEAYPEENRKEILAQLNEMKGDVLGLQKKLLQKIGAFCLRNPSKKFFLTVDLSIKSMQEAQNTLKRVMIMSGVGSDLPSCLRMVRANIWESYEGKGLYVQNDPSDIPHASSAAFDLTFDDTHLKNALVSLPTNDGKQTGLKIDESSDDFTKYFGENRSIPSGNAVGVVDFQKSDADLTIFALQLRDEDSIFLTNKELIPGYFLMILAIRTVENLYHK